MRRDVFQAIADPTRRQIINLLAGSEMNLNEVASNFKISRPAISKHIRILTECGLVKIKKNGRERHASANLSRLKQVSEWTNHYRAFWTNKLDGLEAMIEAEMKQADHSEKIKK